MTALYIILGIFLFFFAILIMPLHLTVSAGEGVSVFARALFVKIPIFPRPKKSKKKKKGKKKKADRKKSAEKKTAKKQKQKPPKPKQKRDIKGLIRLLLKVVGAVLRKMPKHFRVRIYAYEISVATGDAAKTALLYGAVCGLSGTLFSLLEQTRVFSVAKKAPVNVYADFLGEKSKANVKIDFKINLLGVFSMLLAAGMAFVRAKLAEPKNAKAKSEDTSMAETPAKKNTQIKNQNG